MSTLHDVDVDVLEPWRYICDVPGKNVRGMLMDAFQVWLAIPEEKLALIKQIITKLHTASLLIDDIEDDSKLRRGVPVAHKIYGVASTINCSNYVYFLALELCQQLESPQATGVFVAELLNLHRGQGRDILWRDSFACPTEEEYRDMVMDKTGGLFRLAVGLMQTFSENKTDFTPLLNSLAQYFQIRDDFMNLASAAYHEHKSYCEDLTEGKFSHPIIHFIHTYPQDKKVINILKQRTEEFEVKKFAVDCLRKGGSLQYTRETLTTLHADVLRHLEELGGHAGISKLLAALEAQLAECEEVSADSPGIPGGTPR